MLSFYSKTNDLLDLANFTMREQEISPTQLGGGTDVGSMMSTQEEFFSSHFSFDYKPVAH